MKVSRRSAIIGGTSFLAATSLSRSVRAELGGLNLGEGLEDFWLATDAYIFGYPLVTMEMTRRVHYQCREARRHPRPDGAIDQDARSIRTLLFAM